MYRNILVGIIVALTAIMLIVIFLLGNQWYYEAQGDDKFRLGKYHDAAEEFLHALDHAQLVGQARLMYKVALAYQNNRDFDRARDYYFRLVQMYPDSPLTKLVGRQMDVMWQQDNSLPETGSLEGLGSSPIVASHARYVRAYLTLARLMKANQSGVSAELEAAYHAYKTFQEEYKRQVAQALDRYKQEHPGFVWPPEGATVAPDPLADGANQSIVREPPRARPVEPSEKLNMPQRPRTQRRPTDVERELSGAGGREPAGP